MRAALLATLLACLDPRAGSGAAASPQSDRAERFVERAVFVRVEPETEEARRVLKILTDKKHWVGAFRFIEEKIGPFPDDLALRVTFDWDGPEFAQAAATGAAGRVRFNLARLEDYQKKLDEVDRQREEQAKLGRKLLFKVPPARFDRMIYHELTHVLQRGYEAPAWFNEGMAQWLGEDPNCLYAFAQSEKRVDRIDAAPDDANETYARGHLFWNWLAAHGAARKVARAAVIDRRDWKRALEDSIGLPWENLVAAERVWSAKELEKFRPPK
jgi:hypothetical protein